MKILTFFILFFLLAILIIVLAWMTAEIKRKRFIESCIYLENLIERAELTDESYNEINDCFNNLDCFVDADCKRKKHLWASFQIRFRKFSPYRTDK